MFTKARKNDRDFDTTKAKSKNASEPSRTVATDTKVLISELGNTNITRRMLAMNELTDRIGKPAISPLQKILSSKNSSQKVHALWTLQRLDGLTDKILSRAAKDKSSEVRVHAMRILGESPDWNSERQKLLHAGLKDTDQWVQRAAAEALGLHPDFQNIRPLLDLRGKILKDDTHFLHTFRISLRNQLLPEENFKKFAASELTSADSQAIADVSLGITNSAVANFLLRYIQTSSENREKLSDYLRHIARYADSGMEELAKFTENKFADDIDFQLALFKSIQEGTQQRGAKLDPAVADWGARLADKLLASVDPTSIDWRNTPIKDNDATNPWVLQERPSADGKTATVISSFSPGGEKFTGILSSKPFAIPAKLNFYLCGHDGSPEKPPRNKNLIRLR